MNLCNYCVEGKRLGFCINMVICCVKYFALFENDINQTYVRHMKFANINEIQILPTHTFDTNFITNSLSNVFTNTDTNWHVPIYWTQPPRFYPTASSVFLFNVSSIMRCIHLNNCWSVLPNCIIKHILSFPV